MSDMIDRWKALTEILKNINVTISSYEDIRDKGYLIARGDTWNYRTVLQNLGFEWLRSSRTTILRQNVFNAIDYTRISIGSSITKTTAEEKIGKFLQSITNKSLQELAKKLIYDQDYQFFQLPAASANHHAYQIGLAEHVIQVTETAMKLAKYYSFSNLDLDLVISGALLHDIGKMACYTLIEDCVEVTPTLGQMGHVAKGSQMVSEANQKISKPLPESYIEKLLHIILSHQLLKEWESPIEPQTPEAWIVYCADQLSAKVGGMLKYT